MTDNLLAGNTDDTPVIDPNKNYLEELVGDGKKFKTVEDLAKSKIHSDVHISTLEKRFDTLSEEYKRLYDESKTVPKLQELIAKLEGNTQQVTQTPPVNVDNRNTDLMDETKLDSLLENKLAQHEQNRRQQDNYKLVESKVKETLGDNFKTILKQRADSLGLTDTEVTQMAKSNPNLFFKTFDVNAKQSDNSFQAPPASSVRNTNFNPTGEQKRTMKYYEDLRKKDPRAWLDKRIAVQMDKDAIAQGEAFFDV